MNTPYRSDLPGAAPFYGRRKELDLLEKAVRTGRHSLGAVMGGRGMGKTSFALELEKRLTAIDDSEVHLIRRANSRPTEFLQQIARSPRDLS